jgi:hypothetical protein
MARNWQVQIAPMRVADAAAPPAWAAPPASAAPLAQDRASPPPGMAQGGSGPHEGDVFLDGMMLGRWMSRFLSQQAGRAHSGPTGFDPRRGRVLPGATVGG